MSIQVYPEPTTGAGLPYGASTKVFDGEAPTGTYSHTSALAAGDYVLTSVSLDGKNIGATAYSATLNQRVEVTDGQNEYFQTTSSASDWKFTALGMAPTSTATPVITMASPSGNNITGFAVGGDKMIAGASGGIVSISNNASITAAAWTEKVLSTSDVFVSYGNSRYWFAGGATSSPETARVGASTDGLTWTTSILNRYNEPERFATRFVNDRFFFAGARGFVAHSTDGTSWSYLSGQLSQSTTSYAVIYANSKFITAGASGLVFHSTTGAGWDRYATPVTTSLLTLRYLNGLFVSAGASGALLTSNDAITWTSRTSSFGTTAINALTFGNGVYVAAGAAGQLRTSTDAITWTSRTSSFGTTAINGLAYGAGVYVAVGAAGTLTSSTDGITWTAQTSQFGTSAINAVEFVNNLFVAAGAGGRVSSSTDGITWTGVNSGAGTITAVTYANGRYIVGSSGANNSYQSTDLVTWTLWALTGGEPDNSIATLRGVVENGSGTIIAVGASGDIIGSTDGITWNKNYPSVFNEYAISSIVHTGTNYTFFSQDASRLAKSTDLVTWTYHTPNATYNRIAYGNNLYVGVRNSDNLYSTSTDGITWATGTADGNFAAHVAIDFADGYFMKSGYAPTTSAPVFSRSTDGVNWTTINWGASGETLASLGSVTRNGAGWIFNAYQTYYQYVTTTTGTTLAWTLGSGRSNVTGVVATTSNIIIGVNGRTLYSDSLTPTSFTATTYASTSTVTNHIAQGGGKIVYCTSSDTLYSSDNGASITQALAVVSNYAAYSTTQNLWVLAADVAGLASAIRYSTNAITWSAANISGLNANGTAASTTAKAYSVAARDGWFLAGFDEGMAAWSNNGQQWVPQKPVANAAVTFNGAAIGNGKGVLVGSLGNILVADAGSHNWRFASPVFGDTAVNDIAFNNGTFLIVGGSSKVATSTDGITWTLRTGVTSTAAGYSPPFNAVSPYGDTDFIIGSQYGVYRTSNANSPTAFRLYQVTAATLS